MQSLVFGHRLEGFMEELQKRHIGKVDIVTPTKSIRMENGNISVRYGGQEISLAPTNWAHGQIAEKVGIPKQYYDRMNTEQIRLLDQNVNTWLKQQDELRLIRSWNGEMVAYLSNSYRAIDSYDVANIVLKLFMAYPGGASIVTKNAYVTDRVMNLSLVLPDRVYTPFPENLQDRYMSGINVRNSEVGYSAFIIEPFLWRGMCSNGLIYGFEGIRKVHLGERKEAGEYQSQRTTEYENKFILSKVQDTVERFLSPGFYDDVMARFRKMKTENVTPKIIDATVKILGISDEDREAIYKHMEGNTTYDLLQAVTRRGNDFMDEMKDPENAYKFQKLGGQLINTEIWKKIQEQSEKA